MQELNTTEWKIYNYLKERSKEDKWSSQNDISEYLKENNTNIGNRDIRRAINAIRKNETIQKIIITDYKKGYKIMTSEKEYHYLEKRKLAILKMLKQYWRDIEKLKLNNQTRIVFGIYERHFIETILQSDYDAMAQNRAKTYKLSLQYDTSVFTTPIDYKKNADNFKNFISRLFDKIGYNDLIKRISITDVSGGYYEIGLSLNGYDIFPFIGRLEYDFSNINECVDFLFNELKNIQERSN